MLGLPSLQARGQEESRREAIVLTAVGALTPAMREYIERGLELADQRNSELVILELDTPGGSIALMEEIVQSILASPVPVVVYVSPAGAIAGSAGTIITLAADIAAMAPGTAIGAASPVGGQGEDIGETLEAKAKQILRAQIRSLAEKRPPEAIALAEDTVENATAVSDREAYEIGLVDILADNIQDLLRQLDGVMVETETGQRKLDTQFITLNKINITFIEQLLSFLTNPNIVFILLSLGVQAILIELSSPGGWVAGFVGVMSLLLSGYGLGVLPVNWLGLGLFAVAFALFYMEVTSPSTGAFSVGGVIAFIAGALILFNSGGTPSFYRVSVPLVVATGVVTAGTFIAIVTFALSALKLPVRTGQATLVGRIGVTRSDLIPNKTGNVQMGGEAWTAELVEGEKKIKIGERVEVMEV
ncbi:MAG: nodulation protein NfeD, partial [Chloroflexi bacterium]|nr:nodulation protein NfeD [Chloroflexota bacterium]